MIEIKNVSKKLDYENVLDHINLTLKKGLIYGFIGRNGSGKSMLLKTICGFVPPDEGEVIVNNVNLYQTNTFPLSTAALIEHPNYLPDLSGFENLKMLASINHKIDDEQIIKTLETVNLIEEKDKKFKKYSLGMKQKLGIAQVLMEDPLILLLDEPFNGLEEESAAKIRQLLLKEKERGKTIVLATHIKEDIKTLCDEIYVLEKGRIKDKIVNK